MVIESLLLGLLSSPWDAFYTSPASRLSRDHRVVGTKLAAVSLAPPAAGPFPPRTAVVLLTG